MSSFPANFKTHKLQEGTLYLVCNGSRIFETRLIRSSERGFNFHILNKNSLLFKKHLYPKEAVRNTGEELTFQIPRGIVIEKK